MNTIEARSAAVLVVLFVFFLLWLTGAVHGQAYPHTGMLSAPPWPLTPTTTSPTPTCGPKPHSGRPERAACRRC